ncbi:hypothetical protein AAVH_36137, partial [Aphelenchoides avenae]
MPPHHEVSVEVRFLRHGEEKGVRMRNYPVAAGDTVDDVAKSFAATLGGESVVLETKSVLVFDADFNEFAEAEPSEDLRGVQRMQIAFEMHGSDEDCERLLCDAQPSKAIANELQ